MCPQDWAQITFWLEIISDLKRSHEGDCLMEEFQDLVILAKSTGCPQQNFFLLN